MPEQSWQDLIDSNLTGVWHTVKAATPHLLEAGAGSSVTIISSLAGFKGLANVAAYTTTTHGVVGLCPPPHVRPGASGRRGVASPAPRGRRSPGRDGPRPATAGWAAGARRAPGEFGSTTLERHGSASRPQRPPRETR